MTTNAKTGEIVEENKACIKCGKESLLVMCDKCAEKQHEAKGEV